MSLYLKTGDGEVRVFGTRPEIVIAIIVALGVYTEEGLDLTWTAGIDGKHTEGSSHYNGCAADLRTNNIAPSKRQVILDKIKSRLPSDYFVQLEDDHIHLQFKPQKSYTG